MGRLYCRCLNTKIGYSNDLGKARAIRMEQLCSKVPEQLAGKELLEIQQDVGGVIMEHSSLSQVYVVSDWNVHHCSNCSTDIYISHSVKQDKIYAFRNLITDPSDLMQSPQYSEMFGIILQDKDEQELEGMPRKRLSSMNYGREDPVLKLVHSRMKTFLNHQEELMEQRIKKFEEEQRLKFVKLQKHAHEERRRLFVAIYKSRESGITEAMLDQSSTKMDIKSTSPITVGFEPPSAPKNKNTGTTVLNKSRSLLSSLPVKPPLDTKKEMDSNSDDMDDEGMFTFDEEMKQTSHYQVKANDATPFGLSSDDDDDSSTDGSSFHDDSVIRRMVPSSLPMTVPAFMKLKEEEFVGSIDENQIDVAKSIQQLALSVQDTGMFGDLPKPRTNSRRS